MVHLERARAPSREPVVGAVNRTLALGSLGKLAYLLAERARLATRRLDDRRDHARVLDHQRAVVRDREAELLTMLCNL